MGLTTAYLTSTKDLEEFFNALVTAQAPEQFTIGFLQKLDFTSSAHRLFIGMLKGLGFLSENGEPTQRYYDFLDQTRSKVVLAEAVREAYSDLFAINKSANTLTVDEAKNKLRTLTQGKKTDDVIAKMANTFAALCTLADWTAQVATDVLPVTPPADPPTDMLKGSESPPHVTAPPRPPASLQLAQGGLHYNIQIHLPESRDPAVYDAIFRALREHLF